MYYTPQYIVDYIVQNTVGKLIDNKTPKEISKIKIVDPACGSGSFLIGAYQYLLDFHKNYYSNNGKPSKGNKENPLTPEGNLTTAEKKRILLNNIYGVDLDANAVEVTKLSLLLKCMEGETAASIATQLMLFHERVLPTLDNNIKSGNSLIDIDFYATELDFGEERKIKPFNWQKAFPEVFKQGGFDCVIGNPPYVQLTVLDKNSQQYLSTKFKANTDLYSLFIEQSLTLLKDKKDLGFIIPSLFLKGVRYKTLRTVINASCINILVKEYGDGVFEKVKMPTCIIFLSKGKNTTTEDFFTNENLNLFNKIKTIKLEKISNTKRGLEIGKDKLQDKGDIKCLTGGNLDSYQIKGTRFISKSILAQFSKEKEIFQSPKILIRETGNRFFATVDYENLISTRSIYNTRITDKRYSTEFILGIINSTLFKFYFKQFISPQTNIFPKIRIAQLKELPIPVSFEKGLKNEIEIQVKKILQINIDKKNQTLISNIKLLEDRIDYCESRINQLVYELYELTDEEIKIIEAA